MDNTYDGDNRLSADECYIAQTIADNEKRSGYTIMNHRIPCGANHLSYRPNVANASSNNRTSSWNGYGGINGCTVDGDSKLKFVKPTHVKSRQQLSNRVFQAVPNLHRGTVLPGLESRLQNSLDTRKCKSQVPPGQDETFFHAFHPSVSAISSRHIVPEWTWGGDNSRDIARTDEFLNRRTI